MAKIKPAGASPTRRKLEQRMSASLSNSTFAENLLDFMRRLRERAAKEATLPNADANDREILAGDTERLENSVKSLIKVIETHDRLAAWTCEVSQAVRSSDKAKLDLVVGRLTEFRPILNGLVDLKSALWSAFSLGGYVLENPIVKREAKKAFTDMGRQAREQTSKMIDELIVQAPCWKQHPGRTPNAVARADHRWINEQLAARGLKPKKARADIIGISALAKRVDKLRTTGQSSN